MIRDFIKDLPSLLKKLVHINDREEQAPARVLVVMAHPDDPEYFCGGTIAKWVKEGSKVWYVICTSGQAGSDKNDTNPDDLAIIRENEQLGAAKYIGVEKVVFLRHPDGFLENTIELRRKLVREIRLFRPEVVVCGDPTIYMGDNFINHPDHRAAASATMEAVYPLASSPMIFNDLEEEGLRAHSVHKLYIFTWQKTNTWIDITETIDTKVEALRMHHSQLADLDPTDQIRTAAARSAKFLRMKYAEPFRVIRLIGDKNSSNT